MTFWVEDIKDGEVNEWPPDVRYQANAVLPASLRGMAALTSGAHAEIRLKQILFGESRYIHTFLYYS